jgi:hypothetical protein
MFSKKIVLIVTMMAAALIAHVAPAAASGPNCSTGRNKLGYNAGVLAGGSIVRQAWGRADHDPDHFEDFMHTVHGIVHTAIAGLPSDASDFVKCRAKGLGQGVCDELGNIQGGIATACLLDGQTWGELSAQLYCDLSIQFFGQDVLDLLPAPPTNVCGTNFELGCHLEFAEEAGEYAACASYTVAPYTAVFASWQEGLCIYEAP